MFSCARYVKAVLILWAPEDKNRPQKFIYYFKHTAMFSARKVNNVICKVLLPESNTELSLQTLWQQNPEA